ncbi:metallophosphatase family protein [Akkermansiaceae bacterium]|nr:metallophosphatase family protein [Akkermansiaceae bacterium]
MSKIAIFSDVHANLPALELVIEDATEQGVTRFACLGDVVGYGPYPSDCVTRIQELNCICIKGNHDEYISADKNLDDFNEQAQASLEWSRKNLSDSQKDWLASLPYTRRLGRQMLVHATLDKPEAWDYVRNSFDAAIAMKTQNTPICFYGHTHVPISYELNGNKVNVLPEKVVNIDPNNKYLINCGSVGQPRDGEPKASYIIYDRLEQTVSFRRVAYDIQSVADEIRSVGLPEKLADRLITAC